MVASYRDILLPEVLRRGGGFETIAYCDEVSAKDRALGELCRRLDFPVIPESLQASPLPRGYRTTSRRRVRRHGRAVQLELDRNAGSTDLEPKSHLAIYERAQQVLNRPTMSLLARDLNHVIVRGSYSELAVIFNVRGLDGAKVRRLRTAVDELRSLPVPLACAYAFVDPTGSDYYLEIERPKQQLTWKTLLGADHLRLRVRDRTLRYHPTAFCQINESLVPAMVDTAERLLAPVGHERLLDLYCGFGLFGLCLADRVASVRGLDWEGEAIRSAQDNAKRDPQPRRLSYRAAAITVQALHDLPPPKATAEEIILLDPPRSGTAEGVIETLAERHPRRVVHVLCNIDRLEPEVTQWQRCGYAPVTLSALDMFPGTPHLELMVKLEPAALEKPNTSTPRRRSAAGSNLR